MMKPQKIYGWTTAVWVTCVLVHLTWMILDLRGQPPTEEVYTQTLSFQAGVFALTRLPFWIGLLLVVLVVEFASFGRKRKF